MRNPFNPQNLGEAKLKRNVFDLGRNSIFTNDFFKLYPFFCQEIIPGDTVRIDAQIGVRGMPTVFPVQTKCRASMEFYYVRNRTLMDNFEDYIFMTKDIEAPWLRLNEERAKTMISVGSLGDAFNVPSTYASNSAITRSIPFLPNPAAVNPFLVSGFNVQGNYLTSQPTFSDVNTLLTLVNNNNLDIRQTVLNISVPSSADKFVGLFSSALDEPLNDNFRTGSFITTATVFPQSEKTFCCLLRVTDDTHTFKFGSLAVPVSLSVVRTDGREVYINFDIFDSDREYLISTSEQIVADGGQYVFFYGSYDNIENESSHYYLPQYSDPFFPQLPTSNSFISNTFVSSFISSGVVDSTSDSVIDYNPFIGDNPDIRLNVLPFRAYEMCCNYYYRNDKNNPYILDGEAQYNEFIPTHSAGPDDNVYDFHYRNWELDRFTSAIQSPQFGEAPLVGLTYSPTSPTADLTFQGSIDGGETRDYTVKVGVNEDGGIDSIVDFDSDVPSANLQRLQRQIQAGISINDLRITNSFQRFLENTIRRGLRYRNQLKSHFGVGVDYPDIDVPQYIGGASGFLESGQVTNMADSPNAGLGDYVGTLQGGISMRNKITHYCPEHGFIIGIFSLAPIPNYPQSISKVMIKTNPLDYYLPEFGKIGYVPIHYSELMPLQTPSDGSVDDVYGYQRAHYDYMQAFDEVHGDFRTNLRDFTLSRTFKERPLLSESFTVGHPDQLNDIWVANNIADAYNSSAKFMCSSHVSCIMKREVAMVGTPSLE